MTEWSCSLCQSLYKLSVRSGSSNNSIIQSNDRRVHEWTTIESDMIKRAFWMCVLLER